MADSIRQPGVSVIQNLSPGSPTIADPLLPACIVGVAKEIVEVLNDDGTLNTDALLGVYQQCTKQFTLSDYPTVHTDIDNIDVDEGSVRVFLYDGSLVEQELNPGEAFAMELSWLQTRPVLISNVAAWSEYSYPTFDVDGLTLILAIDTYVADGQDIGAVLSTEWRTVTFSGDGLSGEEVATQINAQLGMTVATVMEIYFSGTWTALLLRSPNVGYRASVSVSSTGTANAVLGFGYDLMLATNTNQRVTGSGLMPMDDNDGDFTTPWITIAPGAYYQGVAWTETDASAGGGVVAVPLNQFNDQEFFVYYYPGYINQFLDVFPIPPWSQVGDKWYIDGVFFGYVSYVSYGPVTRFKVGTIDTVNSTYDDDGELVTPVYSVIEHNTAIHPSSPWNPTYGYWRRPNLANTSGDSSTVAAVITNTPSAPATPAHVDGGAFPLPFAWGGTFMGKTLIMNVMTDGESMDLWEYTFTREYDEDAGGVLDLLQDLNAASDGFTWGWDTDHLYIETDAVGAGQTLSLISLADGWATLRFGGTESEFGTDAEFTGLAGTTLRFCFNKTIGANRRWHNVTFATDSVTDAIEAINQLADEYGCALAMTGAEYGASPAEGMVLVSNLAGWAGRIFIATGDLGEGVDNAAELLYNLADPSTNFLVGSYGFLPMLPGGIMACAGSGNPYPDTIYNTLDGSITLSPDILRDPLMAHPLAWGTSRQVYIAYEGVRQDVTASAEEPAPLALSNTTDLQSLLGPVDPDNPLALGMYFAMINGPNTVVYGLGVDEASPAFPYGTPESFVEAFELLQSYPIYSMVPLSQEEVVGQAAMAHVLYMSDPDERGERILMFASEFPTRLPTTVLQSGECNSDTANVVVLDNDPASVLIAQGITDPSSIDEDDDIFITVVEDYAEKHFNVSAVNGRVVTLRTTFSDDFNIDGFYAVDPLDPPLIDSDYSLNKRGSSLYYAGTTKLNKPSTITSVRAQGTAYNSRRVVNFFPGELTATLSSGDQLLPMFYACAALAGQVAVSIPSRPYTNSTLVGFVGCSKSNKLFTESQLDQIAGAGRLIIVDNGAGTAVSIRHQLTTSPDSLNYRELSITIAVDALSKLIRRGTKSDIGVNNISSAFISEMKQKIDAILNYAIDQRYVIDAKLEDLSQSADAEDTLLADIEVEVFKPFNYLRVTLNV